MDGFTIDYNSSETITVTDVNIDLATYQAIANADETTNPLAIEEYLMQTTWDFTLSDNADIAPKGTLIWDGAPLELLGDDIVRGQGGNDDLYTVAGSDSLFGGTGADRLNGGAGKDFLYGGADNDRLIGGSGNDKQYGGKGNDSLIGGNNNDRLFGGSGSDALNGGMGDDRLFGGAGSDVFVFTDNDGDNVIVDFDATDDNEMLDFSAVLGFFDFGYVSANFLTQVGTDVVIQDSVISVTLLNTDMSDLDANDFIFFELPVIG